MSYCSMVSNIELSNAGVFPTWDGFARRALVQLGSLEDIRSRIQHVW